MLFGVVICIRAFEPEQGERTAEKNNVMGSSSSGDSASARGGTESDPNQNEIATYGGTNGAMRLRNRSRGGGDNSSDSGDVVTTTHTISEMHVRERSRSRRRGANGDSGGDTSIRSEKHVVVKMAVRHKSRGSASSDNDEDDEDDDRATGDRIMEVEDDYQEHDANGTNNIEEIDEGDDATIHASSTRPSTSALSSSDMQMTPHVVNDATIQETMVRLVTEVERMKQFCYEQEQTFRRESELVGHLQKEYKALKVMAKEYKYRAREHKRVQRILRSSRKKNDKSHHHSGKERSKSSQRELKSQCRQLEQYQSELALRFQLLQSENTRYEMQVERQLADLRREYTDNYLFASTSTFQ
ncbi:hypothetical protein FI667_g1136, partial [Globisporangium splendens]